MAKPQANVEIAAPAFAGINTEDSPLQSGDVFAEIADNCVIDRYGRIGARRGFNEITTDASAYSGSDVETLSEHLNASTSGSTFFQFANNKMLQGLEAPVDVTPAGHPGITSSNWQHGQVGDISFWAAEGNEMIYYVESTGLTYTHTQAPGNPHALRPLGNVALGAYGRAWVYERSGGTGTLYFSDLLIPYEFDSGSAGGVVLDEVWPNGNDDVVALAAHNGFLLIFGTRQILIYGSADNDPLNNLTLVDFVVGIGCVNRDSVANTGDDVIWLDNTGVRSFNRTIQEKSLPLADVSAFIRSDLIDSIDVTRDSATSNGFAAYSQATGYYMLAFPDQGYIYCFNVNRGPVNEGGGYRVTRWTSLQRIKSMLFTADNRTLVGADANVAHYTNYQDWGSNYQMRFYANPVDFDAPSQYKNLKQVDVTLLGGQGMQFQLLWAFDFRTDYRKRNFTVGGSVVAEYALSEFNSGAEYNAGIAMQTRHINVGGKGNYLTIALEASVNAPVSLQALNIQSIIGRIR